MDGRANFTATILCSGGGSEMKITSIGENLMPFSWKSSVEFTVSYLMDLWLYMKLLMHEYSDIFHLGCSLFIYLSWLVINASSGFHMFFMIVGTGFLVMEHLGLVRPCPPKNLMLTHLIACSLWYFPPSSIQAILLRIHIIQTAGGTQNFISCGSNSWPMTDLYVKTQVSWFLTEIHLYQASPWRIGTTRTLSELH